MNTDGAQSRYLPSLQRRASGMEGVYRVIASTRPDCFKYDTKSPMGGLDPCRLRRPRRHQPFGKLDDAGESGQHGDQFQLHQLEFRPATILPAGSPLEVMKFPVALFVLLVMLYARVGAGA